ncbi:toxin-antitoxin system, antitoxin component, ribbon-helix-helix domain protein [delta proteobacterium NaphS2]|nr:toxin-antitoxin system, antitoxin component, ribbon-helix-helix domain protein [delta proteobacterium NaphS2]
MKKDNIVSKEDLQAVESPPLTDRLLKRMRPVGETHPEIPPKVRGPQRTPTKKSTTIRLNAEVLDFFKAQGNGWQTKINEVLHNHMKSVRDQTVEAQAQGPRKGKRRVSDSGTKRESPDRLGR